jgi:quercetin dioxygenase-like cupin family protein
VRRSKHLAKGQAAFEPAGHVHLARNDTQKTVTLYAVYLALPKGAAPNKPAAAPAGCSG